MHVTIPEARRQRFAEADEEEVRVRYERREHLLRDIGEAERVADAVARLDAALRYSR